jgi:hypothetical protein
VGELILEAGTIDTKQESYTLGSTHNQKCISTQQLRYEPLPAVQIAVHIMCNPRLYLRLLNWRLLTVTEACHTNLPDAGCSRKALLLILYFVNDVDRKTAPINGVISFV